jgi:hypothetical protein
MKQWLTVAALAAGLSLSACGSTEKKDTTPTQPAFTPAPDKEALVGSWSDGTTTVTLNANGSYKWDEAEACRTAPCPMKDSDVGNWELRGDKLYLTSTSNKEEGTHAVSFSFENNQKSVKLGSNKRNANWSLNKR